MELIKRKHPRLSHYDYSQNGAYFVTTNIFQNQKILCDIPVGRGLAPAAVNLTPLGRIVERQLLDIPKRYPNVQIEKYSIMPNHVHVIFLIQSDAAGASPRPTLTQEIVSTNQSVTQRVTGTRPTLMQAVGTWKSLSARLCNQLQNSPGRKFWQDSFYESILQSEQAYLSAWQYIDDNPVKWADDPYHI